MLKLRTTEWIQIVDEWMVMNGEKPLRWNTVLRREHGQGENFFHSIAEAKRKPSTYAGRWFKSKQTWLDFYNTYDYVYSLLYGQRIVSHFAYRYITDHIKSELGPQDVVDVGGSAFTAVQLINLGMTSVLVENFDNSPQQMFTDYVAKKYELPIMTIEHNSIPNKSILICSEYLEHFPDVDVEVERLVKFKPRRIYERSAFATPAYGHYCPIIVNGKEIHEGSNRGRIELVKKMKSLGYNRTIVPGFNKRAFLFTPEDETKT